MAIRISRQAIGLEQRNRPKFLALLADPSIGRIVIEHQDRGTRFGFRSIETLLHTYGREIAVVNQAANSTEDVLADVTSIVYSCCARWYGQRRAKRKTEKIVQELKRAGKPMKKREKRERRVNRKR